MACGIPEDKRAEEVMRLVRLSIKKVDGRNLPITQATSLGDAGLGHACNVRQQYHPEIAKRLAVNGCRMKTVSPSRFCEDDVKWVLSVSNIVLEDLE